MSVCPHLQVGMPPPPCISGEFIPANVVLCFLLISLIAQRDFNYTWEWQGGDRDGPNCHVCEMHPLKPVNLPGLCPSCSGLLKLAAEARLRDRGFSALLVV